MKLNDEKSVITLTDKKIAAALIVNAVSGSVISGLFNWGMLNISLNNLTITSPIVIICGVAGIIFLLSGIFIGFNWKRAIELIFLFLNKMNEKMMEVMKNIKL